MIPPGQHGRAPDAGLRILIIDHGCCDHPHTRAHGIRAGLEAVGMRAAVCGPSTVPGLDEQPAGMYGIHLHDIAAASRSFLAAVRDGSPQAFLTAVAGVPSRLLGLALRADGVALFSDKAEFHAARGAGRGKNHLYADGAVKTFFTLETETRPSQP